MHSSFCPRVIQVRLSSLQTSCLLLCAGQAEAGSPAVSAQVLQPYSSASTEMTISLMIPLSLRL
jgi:hypothetical protein